MTLYQLGLEIADEGGWEEFHQKQHNCFMYDYHKNRRLKLERQYRERFDVPVKRETLDQNPWSR